MCHFENLSRISYKVYWHDGAVGRREQWKFHKFHSRSCAACMRRCSFTTMTRRLLILLEMNYLKDIFPQSEHAILWRNFLWGNFECMQHPANIWVVSQFFDTINVVVISLNRKNMSTKIHKVYETQSINIFRRLIWILTANKNFLGFQIYLAINKKWKIQF